jgi:hypothetical protein
MKLFALCLIALTASAAESSHGWLGAQLNEVDDALAYHLQLEHDLGVLIQSVLPESPAEAMGLKRYDVVVAAQGEAMYTPRALGNLVMGLAPGAHIDLVVRRGTQDVTLSGEVGERPPGLAMEPEPMHPEDTQRRRGDLRQRPPAPHDDGAQSGTIRRPDGSTMEWQVIEDPQPIP